MRREDKEEIKLLTNILTLYHAVYGIAMLCKARDDKVKFQDIVPKIIDRFSKETVECFIRLHSFVSFEDYRLIREKYGGGLEIIPEAFDEIQERVLIFWKKEKSNEQKIANDLIS
jgi:hypothetical protein